MTDGPTAGLPGAGGRGAANGGPLHFGERMTGVEALMWRLGRRDARFRATMSLVVTLEGRVDPAALASRLAALCRAVPRLSERVRESALGAVPPAWEPDPDFSVGDHLDLVSGRLWDVASAVMAAPFDAGRPPWRVVVVPSGGEHGDSVILHLHHSYTDGLGGVRLLGELFDTSSSAAPRAAPSAPADCDRGAAEAEVGRGRAAPGLEALILDVEEELRRAVGLWSRALPWASRTIATARRDPAALLHAAGDLAAGLQSQLGAAFGPASPVLAGRSDGVALQSLPLPLAGLRSVARRLGATVNDVYLAGLLDGLERYHAKLGSVPPSVRLGIPVSNREAEADMRNQLFGVAIRGPLGYLDFDERTRLVHEIVVEGRKMPLASLVEDVAAAAVRFPGGVRAAATALSSLDLMASNVMGPPVPMWLAGVPIAGMTPFGPRSGSALNATLLSYDGVAHIGLNLDPVAVVDPTLLVDCLEAAFAEALGC